MSQKEFIKDTYKDEEVTETFDGNRKRYAYQRHKHIIESDFLEGTIDKAVTAKYSDDDDSNDIKVLDVACGTGRMFREIGDIDNVSYYGIDTSEEMMNHLKDSADDMEVNATLSVGDATDLPYEDNTFDVVYTYHLTWHLPQTMQLKIIKEMLRVTKKDGYILFDILNKNFLWENSKHLFGKKKLHSLYKMSFSDIEELLRGHEYEIEKLSDFPVKSSFLYSLFNVVNMCRGFLPMSMFHMLYFRVQK